MNTKLEILKLETVGLFRVFVSDKAYRELPENFQKVGALITLSCVYVRVMWASVFA